MRHASFSVALLLLLLEQLTIVVVSFTQQSSVCGCERRRLAASRSSSSSSLSLDELVSRKLREADALQQKHASIAESDVRRRLSFASTQGGVRFGRALRRESDSAKQVAVVADLKRQHLTGESVGASFREAGMVAETMMAWPVDAVSVGLESFGGSADELRAARRALGPSAPLLAKELVVDPIQIALAAESGADAVLLMAPLVGNRLEDLLEVATVVGVEAVVEVHTPNECRFALAAGATIILANNYDRIDRQLVPGQALGLKELIPPNVLALASGGIDDLAHATALANAGYDALFLGTSIVARPPADSKPFVHAVRNDLKVSPLQSMFSSLSNAFPTDD